MNNPNVHHFKPGPDGSLVEVAERNAPVNTSLVEAEQMLAEAERRILAALKLPSEVPSGPTRGYRELLAWMNRLDELHELRLQVTQIAYPDIPAARTPVVPVT